MFLSYQWLKELVNIPKNLEVRELGVKMTLHTVEVDRVFSQADQWAKIVVGQIKKIEPHPNADRLLVVQVDIGGVEETIVSGADNIKKGDLVPVARPGARLASGLEIKPVKIRGIASAGMLCAEDELGLGPDHSGILILPRQIKAKPGDNLAKALGLDDIIFEIDNKSITHRPDLWSSLGLAREVAAFLGSSLSQAAKEILALALPAGDEKQSEYQIEIKIEEKNLCPRYMALALAGIKVQPSPAWLKQRLIASGVKPINNIVDITNYVMLELGQPLHAFDIDQLSQDKKINIGVRRARPGEAIKALDGQDYELDGSELLIASFSQPAALAGIIGGADSAINENTKAILLEAATFEPIVIRRTMQKLNLRTEAGQRFEKGLDPNLPQLALARAWQLISQLCPDAYLAAPAADAAIHIPEPRTITLPLLWLEKSLGFSLPPARIRSILTSLEFGLKESSGNEITVKIPTWRPDIKGKYDLAEEIARLYGYNNIKPQRPRVEMKPQVLAPKIRFKRQLRQALALGIGLVEVYNYSFVDESQLKKLGLNTANYIRLANPIASHQTLLRQSLAPNLFNNIIKNQARFEQIGLFELGYIYLPTQSQWPKDERKKEYLPYQEERLGLVFAGPQAIVEFGRAKSAVNYLARWLGASEAFLPSEILPAWADKSLSAALLFNQKEVGFIAYLQPLIARQLGLKKEVVFVSLPLAELFSLFESRTIKYQPTPKFPPLERDLALVVNKNVSYYDLKQAILNYSPLIKKVELFDVYEGEKLGAENKSLAFHITYQADDRTLRSAEADKLQAGLLTDLDKRFGAKIRDF